MHLPVTLCLISVTATPQFLYIDYFVPPKTCTGGRSHLIQGVRIIGMSYVKKTDASYLNEKTIDGSFPDLKEMHNNFQLFYIENSSFN